MEKKGVFGSIAFQLLGFFVGFLCVLWFNQEEPVDAPVESMDSSFLYQHCVYDIANVEPVGAGEYANLGDVSMRCASDIYFETGTALGNFGLSLNSGTVQPCIVEIYRNDTGACIYSTNGRAVPTFIEYDYLLVNLPAGDYPCTVVWYFLERGQDVVTHKLGAEVTVHVRG